MTTLAAGRGIGPAGDDAPQGTDFAIVRWALRSLRLALNELAHMECDAVANHVHQLVAVKASS